MLTKCWEGKSDVGAALPGRDMDCTDRDGEEGIEVTREVEVPEGGSLLQMHKQMR